MTAVHPSFLGRLIRAVALLALPEAAQTAYLEAVGVSGVVDELALEFHDGALLAPQMLAEGWITTEAERAIEELDSILDKLSGPSNAAFWSVASLGTAPEWEIVRERARAVLVAIR